MGADGVMLIVTFVLMKLLIVPSFLHLPQSVLSHLVNREQRDPMWMHSGKFQGDIDGVNEKNVKHNPYVMYNALRNRQLTWSNAIIPYVLDEAFTSSEAKLLHKAFKTYRKKTCIRFRPRRSELDYLNIIRGHGCYSQVGKTGGKQEISLGRGCLFNETIIHELMHSIGFWHEHSRSDRDEHISIRWENITPGMDSQFDIVSPAIQDTLGERYDYKSIMHYGSSAFSKNGRNTIETTDNKFTSVIGTATDLSELDVVKINKLYRCAKREPRKFSAKKIQKSNDNRERDVETPDLTPSSAIVRHQLGRKVATTQLRSTTPPNNDLIDTNFDCQDHFVDCPNFKDYCHKMSFYFIMKSYCPKTCGQCNFDS